MRDALRRAELHSVTAGYGGAAVLSDVTAQVRRGVVNAVVGPNGSGKSTLLNVIAGIVAPTAGRVRHNGSGRTAYVLQHGEIGEGIPMTVRSVVAMGRWAELGPWRPPSARDRAIVEESMARLDVAALAGSQIDELSGGQRQRVLVAQGLAQRADLLLLDEPSAGLDWAADVLIREVLDHECARGRTVVQTTHDIEAASRSQHCLLLDRGRLVAQGPPADVLTEAAVDTVWCIPNRVSAAPSASTAAVVES